MKEVLKGQAVHSPDEKLAHGTQSEQAPTRDTLRQMTERAENETLLMCSRLQNSKVLNQVVSLVQGIQKNAAGTSHSAEQIKRHIRNRVKQVTNNTPVTFDPKESPESWSEQSPGREVMSPHWVGFAEVPASARARVLSMVEAHEKGHFIRRYDHPLFDQHFSVGFDWSKATYETDWEKFKITTNQPNYPLEKYQKGMQKYLASAAEVVERMSQLKNYFGMAGDERFERYHLDYARENYVRDMGGFDNAMTHFFQAITPETEERFLELINSSGI